MMNIRLIVMAFLLTFGSINLVAEEVDIQSDSAMPIAGVTLYMDVSILGRKHGAAKKMTELHEEHFARGLKVIDVDPYIENGDLQGFFITYVGQHD